MPRTRILDSVRRVVGRSRGRLVVAASVVFCTVGGRIGLPGVDGKVVRDFLRGSGGGLLGLYDRVVGGALSRAALLALGVMPYLSARCFLWLARIVNPPLRAMSADESGRAKLTRWTRYVTMGVALVQSYGFARFVESIPGAVAHPGPAFIGQTMIVLTGGAIVAMLIGERLGVPPHDTEENEPGITTQSSGVQLTSGESDPPVLAAVPDAMQLGPGEYRGATLDRRQRAEAQARRNSG